MLSVPERMAQCAEQIAEDDSMGYSQPNRSGSGSKVIRFSDGTTYTIKGGDLDCSEMVRRCVNAALGSETIGYLWTGNEDDELKAIGFSRMGYSASAVRRGDVLFVKGHTGVALGDGMQADAHGDEYGGLTGPNGGDNTGSEVEVRSLRSWTYIYRYPSTGGTTGDGTYKPIAGTYRLTVSEETNVRSSPSMSATITGTLDESDTIECDGWLVANERIWATYIANSGKRRYVSIGTANEWTRVG